MYEERLRPSRLLRVVLEKQFGLQQSVLLSGSGCFVDSSRSKWKAGHASIRWKRFGLIVFGLSGGISCLIAFNEW